MKFQASTKFTFEDWLSPKTRAYGARYVICDDGGSYGETLSRIHETCTYIPMLFPLHFTCVGRHPFLFLRLALKGSNTHSSSNNSKNQRITTRKKSVLGMSLSLADRFAHCSTDRIDLGLHGTKDAIRAAFLRLQK